MLKNLSFENPWDIPKKPTNEQKNSKLEKGDIEDILRKSQDKIFSFINKKKRGNNGKSNHNSNSTKLIAFLVFGFFLAWLATGIFTVDTKEVGIVIRFGKYNRAVGPGLNYKLPTPIEVVEKINVTTVRKDVIGKIINPLGRTRYTAATKSKDDSEEGSLSYPKESQMLTGDENIIDMHFFVQWRIDNAKNYLFNITHSSEDIVRSAAESAMRQTIGVYDMYKALSEQRFEIEQAVKAHLQEMLNYYGAGIEILAVGIEYNYVAPEVKDAYWDVQSAKADREREINQAMAYKNALLPKAKGEAQTLIEESLAYKEAKIANATGDAERFNEIYKQYIKSKEVTKQRMYLETMESIFENTDKIIVDKNVAKNVLPYLPLENIQGKK